jgi:hypothetical protein
MTIDLDKLLSETTMRPPCPPNELADFVEIVGPVPHPDYLDFISRHNGCDGPIGDEGYIRIWSLDNVIARTEQSGTAEFAPGLLLFGGDGGNEAFAFDRQDPKWPIVMVPLVGMSRRDMRYVAATFTEFIRRFAANELWT